MEQLIKEILNDLYQFDSSLKKNELELIKIIKIILKSKPQTVMTKKFKASLKAELLDRISPSPAQPADNKLKFNFNLMTNLTSKLSYGAVGALLLAFIILIPKLINKPNLPSLLNNNIKIGLTTKVNIKSIQNNAFGLLSNNEQSQNVSTTTTMTNETANFITEASALKPISDSNLAVPQPSRAKNIDMSAEIAINSQETIAIEPFVPTYYKFVYKGKAINLQDNQLAVYRRIKNQDSGARLAKALKNIDLGIINIKNLSNPIVENINITENKKDGYMIYFNTRENSLSINRNYSLRQPRILGRPERILTEVDIPNDQFLIKIANNFLRQYALDFNAYGTPEVDKRWKLYYENSPKQTIYVPPMMEIVYPLLLNNQFVYNEDGSKTGARVTIDIRNMEVASVYGVRTNNFEASLYDTEQNSKKLISLAEQGGWRQRYYFAQENNKQKNAKEIEIDLGQPTIEYVKIYYNQIDQKEKTNYNYNQSNELLVPSLIFPVIKVPAKENYWQQYIIVPLIQELLQTRIDRPIIMPLGEPIGRELMLKDELDTNN